MKETKILYQKRKDLSKIQIIESSILYLLMNYIEIASKKIEELTKIKFFSEKNENLKSFILDSLAEGNDKKTINLKIKVSYDKKILEINENSNIQIITKNKTNPEISNLLDELIQDHNDQSSIKKIESLEQKLINNLDENSYSELVKLKSQLNRD